MALVCAPHQWPSGPSVDWIPAVPSCAPGPRSTSSPNISEITQIEVVLSIRGNVHIQLTHAPSTTTFSSPIHLTRDELFTQTLLKSDLTSQENVSHMSDRNITHILSSYWFISSSFPHLCELPKAPLPLLDAVPAASAAGPATCCGRSCLASCKDKLEWLYEYEHYGFNIMWKIWRVVVLACNDNFDTAAGNGLHTCIVLYILYWHLQLRAMKCDKMIYIKQFKTF